MCVQTKRRKRTLPLLLPLLLAMVLAMVLVLVGSLLALCVFVLFLC
jgi:hypothetical protein